MTEETAAGKCVFSTGAYCVLGSVFCVVVALVFNIALTVAKTPSLPKKTGAEVFAWDNRTANAKLLGLAAAVHDPDVEIYSVRKDKEVTPDLLADVYTECLTVKTWKEKESPHLSLSFEKAIKYAKIHCQLIGTLATADSLTPAKLLTFKKDLTMVRLQAHALTLQPIIDTENAAIKKEMETRAAGFKTMSTWNNDVKPKQ